MATSRLRTEAPAGSHVAAAERYARDVLSGAVPACKYVQQAIRRNLADLERSESDDFPFYFDAAAAERVCDFFELLPHVKGPKANRDELWVLEDHQSWYYACLFGWRRKADGWRRFNRAYREIPRGNGKSFEAAGVGNYCAFAEGEAGAEVYAAATARDQAKIVWGPAKRMLVKNEELRSVLGVQTNAHDLYQPATGSVFRALSSDHDNLDGLNVSCAVIDELHAHKTRGLYDVLETAISKRDQALLLIITTAGSDRTGICYEIRKDLIRVLDGSAQDESLFGLIYTLDDGDEWQSESSWRKANPNYGVSVNPEVIRTMAQKALRVPAAQTAFKTKHLNVWVGANAALYDVDAWMKCGDPELSPQQFLGEPALMGVDLATREDLVSRALLFWRFDADGKPHLYCFGQHYIHEDALDDGRNDRYRGWADEGWLTVTPGNTTDQGTIEADVAADMERFEFSLDSIAFDPWQGHYLAQRLIERGAPMVEVRKIVQHFSEPTKVLGALMKEGRIHHNGDPILAWAIGNVVGHYDKKDNVFPQKERPENKIDPVDALLMALSLWLRRQDPYSLNDALKEQGLMVL